ncbi:oxysterol-binding protein 1-like isoform X2 [Paramacrobiotus metropolitanus]|uniref:oxysterol-binding protein 1-like isoform X2 n=1 Tax=Paramacrobiotus metropolitanus TaxID=2943436 RepID=UPI0024461657|nr:oxysterol-binding protein 1-like isoform X2 [Paramacrobiotus metropolitanus]
MTDHGRAAKMPNLDLANSQGQGEPSSRERTERGDPDMKGYLYKWTNYLKGYQKRYFVLSKNVLTYYRSPSDVPDHPRGSIRLRGANVTTDDTCNFAIQKLGDQTFHLKANSEVERQRWITAVELAKTRANKAGVDDSSGNEPDDDEEEDVSKSDLQAVIRNLSSKIDELNACHEQISKQGRALQGLIVELENLSIPPDASAKAKAVVERATLFRLTSTALLNASKEFLTMAQSEGKKWQKMLGHEHDQRVRLAEMVEQLAKQHSSLEEAAKAEAAKSSTMKGSQPGGSSANSGKPIATGPSDEDEFFDAQDNFPEEFVVSVSIPHSEGASVKTHKRTDSSMSLGSENLNSMSNEMDSDEDADDVPSKSQRQERQISVVTRKALGASSSNALNKRPPVQTQSIHEEELRNVPAIFTSDRKARGKPRRSKIPNRPNATLSLWSIMKNCIGRDLSKIPMPVNFSEPLSMLQRLTEDFEYSDILDRAAACDDNCEQMAYVAAFTVSSYATTAVRTNKPFNPLLGETYECDRRDDFGWRAIAEQVSHHPPMVAQHVESRDWVCWQEFTASTKFRGKYLQVVPLGITHLVFRKSDNHYTWRKVTTTVNNIIVGKLWIDQAGDMEIKNHKTGDICMLKYSAYSYFSRDIPRKVTGAVTDSVGKVKFVVNGTWDDHIAVAKVIGEQSSPKDQGVIETDPPMNLWKKNQLLPNSDKMYNFGKFAIELNEPDDDVAPTDSRNRPDQRLMEVGSWDEANKVKTRLEEKQRAVRRLKESASDSPLPEELVGKKPYSEPVWFTRKKDPLTGNPIWATNGRYWDAKAKRDWSACPDIF